jgi:CRISPR/Cas system CSM-associated protein Csm2 small subunit
LKLQDLLKDIELGKVYTDKDRKPFKVNEEKLNEFNKAHFLNLIKQEVDSLKGQIAYSKDKVRYKGTPDWEKKEFKGVLKDLLKKLKDTEKHYKRVQKLKEGFGGVTSPPPFSSPEAKKVVDDALKKYSKELRKLQGKVVKDWMDKAKSGVIDFFDLVRGFQSGNVRRSYPYETEFLMSVLTKDKIIDRFRKYFGGTKAMKNRTAKKR